MPGGVREASFSQDFIKMQVVEGLIPIESASKEVEVQFYYDKNNLQRVQGILCSWGTDSLPKWLGKLYQKGNHNVLCRNVRFKEENGCSSTQIIMSK
jgi:hypothetical protein